MKEIDPVMNSIKYSDVTRAMSRDFSRLFSVNTVTDEYVEYTPHEQDEALDVRTAGDDFGVVMRSFLDSAYPADLDTVRAAISKENILGVLNSDDSFTLTYRMMIDGKPTYVRIKATRLNKEDPSHILVGLSNTDAHMKRLTIYERTMNKQLTFAAVSEALSADYDCIFYVNSQSGEFVEYSSSERFKSLNLPLAGQDFFETCKIDFSRFVYEEDLDVFLRAFNKENLLKVLDLDRLFLLTFRVVLSSTPVHVRVKITKMTNVDDHHLVVGLSNIESNMQRVQQYEKMKEIANRDPLTGVRSKHAYSEDEIRFNKNLAQGKAEPFGVVVCDVNGLKKINDTQGHKAGDDYLRRSCKMICLIFSHSPIYRVGGDEFAVLLTGSDYENRQALIQELHNLSVTHIGTNEGVVSGGLAEYDPDQDRCVSDVFERADALMYKEKMLLKSQGAVTRDVETEESSHDTEDIPIIYLRRHILIADDQETNREILGELLETDYDILYACDGIETISMLHQHKNEIALVLLDLYMPNMDGREVLREMQVDEDLMSIPVIMLTSDQDAELYSLRIGALDFISKPYPDINIVKARIAKCIELSENRYLIQHTQRDKLTGLLHYDYFIQYLDRYDHLYKETPFDAFVCDINHFHALNEQYGHQFGDLVLRSIGNKLRKLARKTGGIGCRKGGDTFMLYCPHQEDFKQLIQTFQEDLFVEKETADKVGLRFGVYTNANHEPDVEERFVCARLAADSFEKNPDQMCGFFDSSMR